jgi:hypothetical protein
MYVCMYVWMYILLRDMPAAYMELHYVSNMLTAVVHHSGSLCRNRYAEKVFI